MENQGEEDTISKRTRRRNGPISGWRSADLRDFCPFPLNERQMYLPFEVGEEFE